MLSQNGADCCAQRGQPVGNDDLNKCNDLLTQYASLLIDPCTGEAKDKEKEKKILDGIVQVLEARVSRYSYHVWHRRRFAEVEDVRQGFWEVFVDHLRRQRMGGATVRATAWTYIYRHVQYAAGMRGLSPKRRLNLDIHEYVQNIGDREVAEHFIYRDIMVCCKVLMKRLAANPKCLSEAEEAWATRLAETLMQQFLEEAIWQTPVWPTSPATLPLNVIPQYVSDGEFDDRALLILRGGEGGRAALQPVLAETSRTTPAVPEMKQIITRRCEELAGPPAGARSDTTSLRQLLVLLFLPYYDPEDVFCKEYSVPSGTKHNCKHAWVEMLVRSVCRGRDLPESRQAETIKVVTKPDHFARLIAATIEFAWLECSRSAREKLAQTSLSECNTSRRALLSFWRVASDQTPERDFDGRGEFRIVRVGMKNDPPEGLLCRREGYDGLVLLTTVEEVR